MFAKIETAVDCSGHCLTGNGAIAALSDEINGVALVAIEKRKFMQMRADCNQPQAPGSKSQKMQKDPRGDLSIL